MVFKAVIWVLFSSMLFSQESSGLSQRLNAIDAQEQEILSSFEKIKKEQEAKEEQSLQVTMQNEENTTLSTAVSSQEKTGIPPDIKPNSVDEAAQKDAREVANEAKKRQDSDTMVKPVEKTPQVPEQTKRSLQYIPQKHTASKTNQKTKVHKKKLKKPKKKSAKKQQPAVLKTKPQNQIKTETVPSSVPMTKKRTALEHLDSVLNVK